MYDFHFLFIRFVALRYQNIVSCFGGSLFNATQHAREKVMYQLRHNYTDCIRTAGSKIYCKYVRLIIMLAGVSMYKVAGFLADIRVVLQRS